MLVLFLVIPSQLITHERNKVWKTDIFLYRNDVSIYPQSAFINNILGRERLKPVLVEMAKDFTDFAHDDSKNTNYQTSLINGFELDVSNGCVESCEIY